MAYFHTKMPNLDKFCGALNWKMLVYRLAIWYFWYIFPGLVCFTKENLATLTRAPTGYKVIKYHRLVLQLLRVACFVWVAASCATKIAIFLTVKTTLGI
jgi:hypothetical protein